MLRDRIRFGFFGSSGRDHWFHTTLDVVAVVAFVAEETVRINIVQLHQRVIIFDFMRFTAGHVECQRATFGVRAQVDFGREAAAREGLAREAEYCQSDPGGIDCPAAHEDRIPIAVSFRHTASARACAQNAKNAVDLRMSHSSERQP
jgi:hypothetical protein